MLRYYSPIMASERLQRQIDRLLDEAEEAISSFDWDALLQRARAVLAMDPENRDALAFLATAERAIGSSTPPPTNQPNTSSQSTTPTAAQSNSTSFADGRYQVKSFLGEGGKKKVYLAHDASLDRDVAFALIRTEGLDEVARTRITREAQAMGRLGSHPYIVTVFDLGQEADLPYMVTELMGGGDVESLIEQAQEHRVSLEQALRIAKEVCLGLEFAQSRGIVHRDLKPGNVWLTVEGTAKIGDFGLAVVLDRSRLTSEGMMVGTVSYMPPEQAMGGEVTPSSDLYSLGAMLYEMVAGRPPFLGDDSVSIIGQHINTPPVAPSWHNPQCPRALEALILRLLAKDPSERPGTASDVLAALEGIDLGADSGAQGLPTPQDDAHALDSLAGGVFVGRHQEMGDLKAALEDALSGRGRLMTLVGEPGIGKTRTAQELATYAGLRGAQVLWGRCYEEQGTPPYWPWVQAIRSYVRDREPDQLQSEMGAGAADIAQIVSDVRERLPGLSPSTTLESPEQARFRLFDSITAFLKAAGTRQPLVLVLDDLHWADTPSLLLLQFVARELGGGRLLLVGTYRDVELSRQHPLAETLGELTRERLFQRVLLRGLGQQDVGRFIEMVSGFTPPHGLVDAVYRQTEGNPLFVTEVVRLLVQEGELSADEGRHGSRTATTTTEQESWSVRIPEGVREVVGRRLNRLSQRCNETLTIASVVGREFSLPQLGGLIDDLSQDRLLEVLEEAMATKVIEELPRSVGTYQFTHALIQETLTQELSTTRRVRLHARIAEVLEGLYEDEVEGYAAELAHHFAEAQSILGSDKLVRYSLLAGERALSSYAYEEAQSHFERGLAAREGQTMDMEKANLLFGTARAHGATVEAHRTQDVVDQLKQCFDYYKQNGAIAMPVAVAQYPVPPAPGYPTGMVQVISEGLSLVPEGSLQEGRLQSLYGRVIFQEEGDYGRARAALDKALEIANREGDTALELQTLSDTAEFQAYNNQWPGLPALAARCREINKNADDLRSEVSCTYFATLGLLIAGNPAMAQEHVDRLNAIALRLGHRFPRARTFFGHTLLHSALGNWQTAREFNDQGLELSPNDSRLLYSRTLLEHQVGDFDAGSRYLQRLLEGMELTPPGPTLERVLPSIAVAQAARLSGQDQPLEVAEAAAVTILSSPVTTPLIKSVAEITLGLIAVIRGDAVLAKQQYGVIELVGIGVPFSILEHRLLGLLSHTMGNLDQAMVHFEDSLAFCRKAGYRPELAWTCCDYADALLQRAETPEGADGDRAHATSLLDEALAISSELGMRPLTERVLSKREILGA